MIAFIASYYRIPLSARDVIDDSGFFYWLPVVGALILQTSVRGVVPKLVTIVFGSVAFLVIFYFLGIVTMAS